MPLGAFIVNSTMAGSQGTQGTYTENVAGLADTLSGADGAGGTAAVPLATLLGSPPLGASDIVAGA